MKKGIFRESLSGGPFGKNSKGGKYGSPNLIWERKMFHNGKASAKCDKTISSQRKFYLGSYKYFDGVIQYDSSTTLPDSTKIDGTYHFVAGSKLKHIGLTSGYWWLRVCQQGYINQGSWRSGKVILDDFPAEMFDSDLVVVRRG